MPDVPEDPIQAQWDLDDQAIQAWLASIPAWAADDTEAES